MKLRTYIAIDLELFYASVEKKGTSPNHRKSKFANRRCKKSRKVIQAKKNFAPKYNRARESLPPVYGL